MFRKIRVPTYEGEMNTGKKFEEWFSGMNKYFRVHKYSSEMKARLSIYNLNGKAARWWRDLKHTKKEEVREICWKKFHNIFREKYMSERFFDRKVKEFHDLSMGSMTMDSFINRFIDLLHYVPYIKDDKVKIQQFLGCLPPKFWERIEFDMPKTLDTTLHKARIFYENG